MQGKRLGRCEALWESSKLGDMPLEEGGVAIPHNEEGLHRGSFPPQEELSSHVEFWEKTVILQQLRIICKSVWEETFLFRIW